MESQKYLGHSAILLYPGKATNFHQVTISTVSENFYEIVNPLPVAITYGISTPERYMQTCNKTVFHDWLMEVKPAVIHVHSIQGIYREFFESARDLHIPMVFTTHDYYPLCYNCTLVRRNGGLCQGRETRACAICNQGAGLSKNRQIFLQSPFYQKIKNIAAVKYLKKKFISSKSANCDNKKDMNMAVDETAVNSFEALGKYYDSILNCFTAVHANSPRTAEVYATFRSQLDYRVIPITHSGLVRSEHIRKENETIKFGYMGGMFVHKGYYLVQEALKLLDEQGQTKWEAWYYGGEYAPSRTDKWDSRKHFCGLFKQAQAAEVWSNIDVLLVPCVCGETYGFVVLEALCHGVPVICSDLAGSKFLVEQVSPQLVFSHEKVQELVDKITWISQPEHYVKIVEKISTIDLPISMHKHSADILSLYNQLLSNSEETVSYCDTNEICTKIFK